MNGVENIRQQGLPSLACDGGERDTGWVAQPPVHLFDRPEGWFAPRKQVVNCESSYPNSAVPWDSRVARLRLAGSHAQRDDVFSRGRMSRSLTWMKPTILQLPTLCNERQQLHRCIIAVWSGRESKTTGGQTLNQQTRRGVGGSTVTPVETGPAVGLIQQESVLQVPSLRQEVSGLDPATLHDSHHPVSSRPGIVVGYRSVAGSCTVTQSNRKRLISA